MSVCRTAALLVATSALAAASLCAARQKDGILCPRHAEMVVKFKQYYQRYFNKNGTAKSLYPGLLRNVSRQCCSTSRIVFQAVNDTKDIEEHIVDDSCRLQDESNDSRLTFYFPVYVSEGEKVAFDDRFEFVQLAKSPGPAIIMLTSEKDKMRVTALVAVRESLSLFVLIVSLSLTVGLLGWLLDHSSNPSQFSSWFYKGSLEGFWWAMVTITTVGYGDKVPVAFLSRLLTILWMFTGAIILALFTANVTSVLTSNQVDTSKNLIGYRIAVLNSKHYFESTLNVGGTIQEFHSEENMVKALEGGTIDRILTPSANYKSFFNQHDADKLSIVDVIPEPFLVGLVLVNKLTKNDEVFLSCLKKKIKLLKYQTTSNLLNDVQSQDKGVIRTTMLFQKDILSIIYYNLIAIGVIAGVGIFLDVVRLLRSREGKSSSEEVEMRRLDSGR